MVKLGGRNLVRALCTVFAIVALTTYVLNKRLEASELVDFTIPDVEEQHVEAIDVSRYGKAVGKAADPRNQLDMFGTVPENNSTYYRPPKNGRMLSLTNKGHKPCPGGAPLVPAYNGPTTISTENDGAFLGALKNRYKGDANETDVILDKFISRMESFDLFPQSDDGARKRHRTCAVVGASGLLRLQEYGAEIDAHEAVFRINSQPTEGYEPFVGRKTTYNMVNVFMMRANHREEYVSGKKPCPVYLVRHEILCWFEYTKVLIARWQDMVPLIAKQAPLFSEAPPSDAYYTQISDFNYTNWLLIYDTRTYTKARNVAEAFHWWAGTFPKHCPKPRMLHPAFDVYTKMYAGAPAMNDYSSGVITLLFAASVCDAVNIYGFGGPVGPDGIGHYDDSRMDSKRTQDFMLTKLAEMKAMIDRAADAADTDPKKLAELHNELVTAAYYHPLGQERALIQRWTAATLHDMYFGGRLQLDMSQFYRCPGPAPNDNDDQHGSD